MRKLSEVRAQFIRRTINNEIMGHALAPVEQQKMEYKELNYSFGDVEQLPHVCKNRN
jgi:hypothetical protein